MAAFKKNDKVILKIEDMGTDGTGIGKLDGYTLFVKDALIGDEIEAVLMKLKKNYGYARMVKIVVPSRHRIEPKCPVHRQCGGCQFQALDYAQELKFKQNKILNNLIRIGGFLNPPMEPILGMKEPYFYRNKAQFPVGTDKEGNPITGFYAGRTHTIIPCTDCCLGQPVNHEILEKILSYMKENQISAYEEKTGTGLIRHILIRSGFTTGEILVCLVLNGTTLPREQSLVSSLKEIPSITSIMLNINTEKTNVILGKKTKILSGQGFITDFIGNIKFQISPLSFYQVNPVQTKVLYEKALDYASLTGTETVWDLYCGIGTISLFLAQKAKQVYGVEIVPQAVRDARKNASLNSIQNVEFYEGKAEEVVPEIYEKTGAQTDVVVVDPPRKGCEEHLLITILKMSPKRIVYVSCDSATLARDLRFLCDRGYELQKVQGVDQFGRTGHVETVCLLSRKTPDAVIEVNLDMSELDITSAEAKATYEEIKAYVKNKYDLHVSNLYIAQVKQKYGIIERENYNTGSGKSRIPKCPIEKHDAIVDALKYYQMI